MSDYPGPVTLTPMEREKIGLMLGESINLQIQVIAMLEQVEPHVVFDEIVERYIANKIIEGEP